MSFLETAKTIIKGYFEQYPVELENLKNAESEKNFQSYIYNIEDSIKDSLNNNKYEFGDLLSLFLSGKDDTLNNEFSEWFSMFCPDSSEVLEYINNPETLLYFLLCDNIDYITIRRVLFDDFGVEPPKPPKPSDNEILQKINNFCLVNKNISKTDILRVLGGAENE